MVAGIYNHVCMLMRICYFMHTNTISSGIKRIKGTYSRNFVLLVIPGHLYVCDATQHLFVDC